MKHRAVHARYARIFAPDLPVEFILPMQRDDPHPIVWKARLIRSRDFRVQLAQRESAAIQRSSGEMPSVSELTDMVDRQKERVAASIESFTIPTEPPAEGDPWGADVITDAEEIRAFVFTMTPTAYNHLESALMGSAELLPLEKKS